MNKHGRSPMFSLNRPLQFGLFAILIALQSCDNESVSPLPDGATPFEFPEMKYFPTARNLPKDNPMTLEGIELGRYLFYDGRLSGRTHPDSLMSCGSCHRPSKGFELGTDKYPDGFPRSVPVEGFPDGRPMETVTLPTVNLVFNTTGYRWNGLLEESNEMKDLPGHDFSGVDDLQLKNLEALPFLVIGSEREIHGNITKTIEVISGDPRYPPMFKKAFGSEEVTAEGISKAISQFTRSIVSYDSKFHRWLRKEVELMESEKRGHEMFTSEVADCFHCHGGSSLLTTNRFFNNGKDSVFSKLDDRYSITGNPGDIGAFRAPSLLNVALNGPYMHDGRFQTLDEVINFYSEGLIYSEHVNPLMKNVGRGGLHLTDRQKEDLKAFLLTLTDTVFTKKPEYNPPPDFGEWTVE